MIKSQGAKLNSTQRRAQKIEELAAPEMKQALAEGKISQWSLYHLVQDKYPQSLQATIAREMWGIGATVEKPKTAKKAKTAESRKAVASPEGGAA
jgi:hypothetical protein